MVRDHMQLINTKVVGLTHKYCKLVQTISIVRIFVFTLTIFSLEQFPLTTATKIP